LVECCTGPMYIKLRLARGPPDYLDSDTSPSGTIASHPPISFPPASYYVYNRTTQSPSRESLRSRDFSSIPKPIIQQETVRWMDAHRIVGASGFNDVPSGRGINSGHLFHSEYWVFVGAFIEKSAEALHPTLCLFVSSRVHSVRMFQYQHQPIE
jgi:hypothetical protein